LTNPNGKDKDVEKISKDDCKEIENIEKLWIEDCESDYDYYEYEWC
jgi:hypothetical protein